MRPARPADAGGIARAHVAAWRETYPGLLPDQVIEAMCDPACRLATWEAALAEGALRVAVAERAGEVAGFAAMGAQRDAALAARGYAEEVRAIYLLRAAQGRGAGRALLRAVWGEAAATALVVEGNPACRFYEAVSARHLETRDERIGGHPARERVHGSADGRGP